MNPADRHIKSRQRVADHGEVFTPAWLVDAMLDLVKRETERIDSRVLEPACGSGNFLVPVLRRKLTAVERRYGRSEFERRHYALLALMCTYGIELLADNIAECRANLLEAIAEPRPGQHRRPLPGRVAHACRRTSCTATRSTMRTHDDAADRLRRVGLPGQGKFQRRDFRLDALTLSSAFSEADSLFAELGKHEHVHPGEDLPADDVRRSPTSVADRRTPALAAKVGFSLRGRNPDVPSCIANLSNDEVFTPPELANQMLDALADAWAADNDGANIWADQT